MARLVGGTCAVCVALVALLGACQYIAGIDDRSETRSLGVGDPIDRKQDQSDGDASGGGGGSGEAGGAAGVGSAGAGGDGGSACEDCGSGGKGGAVPDDATLCPKLAPKRLELGVGWCYPPALAYANGLWLIAWADWWAEKAIYQSAFSTAGVVQAAGAVKVAELTGELIAHPELSASGGMAYLAYSELGDTGAYPVLRAIDVSEGVATVHGPVQGHVVAGQAHAVVGRMAAHPSTGQIVVPARLWPASATTPSKTWLSAFSSAPVLEAWREPSAESSALSLAWSGASERFGLALVTDETALGGKLVTYDQDLKQVAEFRFSGETDVPVVLERSVDVAPHPEGFVVVWVDKSAGSPTVEAAVIDGVTGERKHAVRVGDPDGTYYFHPKVLTDGDAVVIAWLESASSRHQVMWRRFDRALGPRGSSACATCGLGLTAGSGPFGLAMAGPNDYGIVAAASEQSAYLFSRIVCAGP